MNLLNEYRIIEYIKLLNKQSYRGNKNLLKKYKVSK